MFGSSRDASHPDHLEPLDWSAAHAEESLSALRRHVVNRGERAIAWYQGARRPKKQWATWLRMGAILSGGAAGVIPIISQTYPQLYPGWASIALALAAIMIAADRFFGYSHAWMRFMQAEQQLQRALSAFELEWEEARAARSGSPPTVAQVQDAVARAKAFMARIGAIEESETAVWLAEFARSIEQVDDATSTADPTRDARAVTIRIPERERKV
jgi:hypothetical protein